MLDISQASKTSELTTTYIKRQYKCFNRETMRLQSWLQDISRLNFQVLVWEALSLGLGPETLESQSSS